MSFIGGVFDSTLQIQGSAIDRLDALVTDLIPEMFPDTAVKSLPDWERTRGVYSAANASTSERQAAVAAKEASLVARKKEDFYGIAKALGFNKWENESTPAPNILIEDGLYLGFIVGYSIIGKDVLYDGSAEFNQNTITVRGHNVSSNVQLQALFNSARNQGTHFVFTDWTV
jgi:hypothetical protein